MYCHHDDLHEKKLQYVIKYINAIIYIHTHTHTRVPFNSTWGHI